MASSTSPSAPPSKFLKLSIGKNMANRLLSLNNDYRGLEGMCSAENKNKLDHKTDPNDAEDKASSPSGSSAEKKGTMGKKETPKEATSLS
jgi:hypothetical protein